MAARNNAKFKSAVFLTFAGNCKKALTFYQDCFGGVLQLKTFEKKIQFFPKDLVISGSLVSDSIIIHGSDLVHEEGRRPGNHMSVFVSCKNAYERRSLVKKLDPGKKNRLVENDDEEKLVEVTDVFDVRWMLGV